MDSDKAVRLINITKACKIIADILPNLDENHQIKDNMKDLLPKLIKNLDILKSPITRLLKCFIEIYCKGPLTKLFIGCFAAEFHEKELESEKEELLNFIFEIIRKAPREDIDNPTIFDLLREFMICKYFSLKRDRKAIVLKLMQEIHDRTGKFIQLEQEFLKGIFKKFKNNSKG